MDTFLQLANRTHEVVVSNLSCLGHWGFFLFDREFKGEFELRTRIGVIWLCSLLDTMEAQQRFLPEIEAEANAAGFSSIAASARELQKFCALVGELLNEYSREEQIYLQDYRNQLVHSYLAARHRESIPVKFFSGGRIVSERLPFDEYHGIVRSFIQGSPHWEKDVYDMLTRVISMESKHSYWNAVGVLKAKQGDIYELLRSGGTLQLRA